jgi:hypothetical protein
MGMTVIGTRIVDEPDVIVSNVAGKPVIVGKVVIVEPSVVMTIGVGVVADKVDTGIPVAGRVEMIV